MVRLRSLVFLFWLYGMMAIFGIAFAPSFLLPRRFAMSGIRLYARTIRFGLRVICGVQTEIRGQENMPSGAVIYAGKHHCMLDVFIPFLTTRDPAIILKKELALAPFLGWYALKTDMIVIDRAGTSKTLKQILRAGEKAKGQGRAIVIFPEGTRREPGAAPDYKAAGISALNKALDLPTVPVATNAGLCWPRKGLSRRPGRIVYEILPPLPPGLGRKEYMDQLRSALETASDRLLAEGLAAQQRSRAP